MVTVSAEVCAVVACAAGLVCALGMRLTPGRGALRVAERVLAGGAMLLAAEWAVGAPVWSLAAEPLCVAAAGALGLPGALLALCARYLV